MQPDWLAQVRGRPWLWAGSAVWLSGRYLPPDWEIEPPLQGISLSCLLWEQARLSLAGYLRWFFASPSDLFLL